MFGKVVQLVGNPMKGGFKTVYGIDDVDFQHDGRYDLDFANVTFGDINPNVTKTYIHGGHLVREEKDGFKKVIIFNGELSEEDNEEYLLVIIPYAYKIHMIFHDIVGI